MSTLVPFAPTLETERLILRGPEPRDIEPFIAFAADPRANGFGGTMPRDDAWRWFGMNIGHWHIKRFGYFFIQERATGKTAGISGIWMPEGWPEPEIGWSVFAGFEGKSIAFEAAQRVRQHVYEDHKWDTITSMIVPGNTRSEALAKRMGCTLEGTYENPHMGLDQIFRHPSREALGYA
ncbi:MAG: GNAT family N-acetyltransferase [Paracoccaceae bacterium]|jgi:RimJ/RimL family protein N-acetyltransferase